MSDEVRDVPFEEDPVAISLGFVQGKTWPEDAVEPGPHYWRVPGRGDVETIHQGWCAVARRSNRKRPWFWADGKENGAVLTFVERRPGLYRPCGTCWRTFQALADEFGSRQLVDAVSAAICAAAAGAPEGMEEG